MRERGRERERERERGRERDRERERDIERERDVVHHLPGEGLSILSRVTSSSSSQLLQISVGSALARSE